MTSRTADAPRAPAAPKRKAEWAAPRLTIIGAESAEFGAGASPDGPYPPS